MTFRERLERKIEALAHAYDEVLTYHWHSIGTYQKQDFKAGAQSILPLLEECYEALKGWQGWAESMVDEGVLGDELVAEYHKAAEAKANLEAWLSGGEEGEG